MIPIHLKHPDNLHCRFAEIDGSMRLLKTKMGIDWIFPKSCIAEKPVLVQTSTLAISPVDDNLFWDTSNHGPNQIPVLIGTQMGLHFLSKFKGVQPNRIGTIGLSVLSGAVGGFSLRSLNSEGEYIKIK